MAEKNSTIMAKVWLQGTNDFQQRIPDPTQAGITATMEALFDPLNAQYFNQFMSILVNRISFTYVRGKAYDNPLKGFKDGKLEYGNTIQEIFPKWIKAHSYGDNKETLLKLHRPEAAQWFHSVNREDYYPISINRVELRQAFTSDTGLNQLVAGIMQAPMNSDEYDEYLIMRQLIGEYEKRWGFFKHKLSAAPTDEATGKEFLTAVRSYTCKMQFPSTLYNAQNLTDCPVFAKPNELMLLVTPETDAVVDVNTLANLFNLEKADVQVRKVIIDEFPIPNAVALLTTQDFFVCTDTEYETTSFTNAETLTTNYYLHHWGIYSVSPFVPAILFTTGDGTDVATITQTANALTLEADKDTAKPGDTVKLTAKLGGTVTPESEAIVLAPDSVTYSVSIKTATKNARTYVDRNSVLHIQKSIEATDEITVTAVSTYINPSGATTVLTASKTITIA